MLATKKGIEINREELWALLAFTGDGEQHACVHFRVNGSAKLEAAATDGKRSVECVAPSDGAVPGEWAIDAEFLELCRNACDAPEKSILIRLSSAGVRDAHVVGEDGEMIAPLGWHRAASTSQVSMTDVMTGLRVPNDAKHVGSWCAIDPAAALKGLSRVRVAADDCPITIYPPSEPTAPLHFECRSERGHIAELRRQLDDARQSSAELVSAERVPHEPVPNPNPRPAAPRRRIVTGRQPFLSGAQASGAGAPPELRVEPAPAGGERPAPAADDGGRDPQDHAAAVPDVDVPDVGPPPPFEPDATLLDQDIDELHREDVALQALARPDADEPTEPHEEPPDASLEPEEEEAQPELGRRPLPLLPREQWAPPFVPPSTGAPLGLNASGSLRRGKDYTGTRLGSYVCSGPTDERDEHRYVVWRFACKLCGRERALPTGSVTLALGSYTGFTCPCQKAEPKPADGLTRESRRSRRKRDVRARTISVKRMPKRELAIGAALYPEAVEGRPLTRGECAGGSRPCPFVGCAHHLYLDVSARTGAIKVNFPDLEPEDLGESCALDVADRGGTTLEEVGAIMNFTRERCRQIEVKAMARFEAAAGDAFREYADEGPVGRRRLPVLAPETEDDAEAETEELDFEEEATG